MEANEEFREDVISALTVLVGAGLFQDMDDQSAMLLEALRDMTPDSVEIKFYDAWLAMRRTNFAESARILTMLAEESRNPKVRLFRALLSANLMLMEDPAWRGIAETLVMEGGEPVVATELARQLLTEAEAAGAGSVFVNSPA